MKNEKSMNNDKTPLSYENGVSFNLLYSVNLSNPLARLLNINRNYSLFTIHLKNNKIPD